VDGSEIEGSFGGVAKYHHQLISGQKVTGHLNVPFD
jgi:hypothetical protein